jgi:hypothetical protein
MGNAHALRWRVAPAAIVAALLLVAALVALGALARPAAAQQAFTKCSTCHDYSYGDAYHGLKTHSEQACPTCHVNGSGAAGLVPSACVSCHGTAAQIIADPATSHGSAGCGTTPGCHGVPPATVTTTMTLKAPRTVRVRKTVKFTGTAGPLPSLAGAKVNLKVERKVGTKWIKMKTAAKTVGATGAFSWSYKTAKKGTHRVTASIAKTSTHTAKKLVKSFKVK